MLRKQQVVEALKNAWKNENETKKSKEKEKKRKRKWRKEKC